jgi:hypothetical protein
MLDEVLQQSILPTLFRHASRTYKIWPEVHVHVKSFCICTVLPETEYPLLKEMSQGSMGILNRPV